MANRLVQGLQSGNDCQLLCLIQGLVLAVNEEGLNKHMLWIRDYVDLRGEMFHDGRIL